jgi:hypothetical protein
MDLTAAMLKPEIAQALRAYERHIVCLEKTPEEFEASVMRLIEKAIKAYVNRAPNLRHGIALDQHVSIILSQSEGPRPLCGIYFNLHSPYQRKSGSRG